MTLVEDFRAQLRDRIGPLLRQHGFRGSAPTWRLASPRGDVVVINVQSSQSTSASMVKFCVNFGVVPEPWWAMLTESGGRAGKPIAADGIWTVRLGPPGQWWRAESEESLQMAIADVASTLADEGVPLAVRLLDRDQLVDQLRGADSGRPRMDADIHLRVALLLADDGLVSAAEHELDRSIAAREPNSPKLPRLESVTYPWIRRRAQQRLVQAADRPDEAV